MSQITLRDLDPIVEKKIRKVAKETGKSINRVVKDLISKSAGSEKKPAAHSLIKLAGGWTDQEAIEFFDSIRSCEQIDEEMWK